MSHLPPDTLKRILQAAGLPEVGDPALSHDCREAIERAVASAFEEGYTTGRTQAVVDQTEGGLLAWREGAKFGLLALAKQEVAFLTDSLQQSAVKVAVQMCAEERDRMAASAATLHGSTVTP